MLLVKVTTVVLVTHVMQMVMYLEMVLRQDQ